MAKNKVLPKLLKDGRSFHVVFGNGLANHLSMSLVALEKMGATEDRLIKYYNGYIQRLEELPPGSFEKTITPLDSLGDVEMFRAHLFYFLKEIEEKGFDVVLNDYLPHLLPGLCASAFHALIRLGYGVDAGDEQEIAYALAYLSTHFQSLGEPGQKTDEKPIDILNDIAALARDYSFKPGIIADRMQQVVEMESYQQKVRQPRILTMSDLSELAVSAYLLSGNFTLLHGVTGLHALRMLLPWIDDKEQAYRFFWQALLVAYLSTGSVKFADSAPKNLVSVDWEQIKQKAILSDDEHVIKILYTCWQEYFHYHNEDYLKAARMVVSKNF